jgi:hypothetical protein
LRFRANAALSLRPTLGIGSSVFSRMNGQLGMAGHCLADTANSSPIDVSPIQHGDRALSTMIACAVAQRPSFRQLADEPPPYVDVEFH